MNRRALLQGMAAGVAGLLLPASIAENAEAASRAALRRKIATEIAELEAIERRYWALDRTMISHSDQWHIPSWRIRTANGTTIHLPAEGRDNRFILPLSALQCSDTVVAFHDTRPSSSHTIAFAAEFMP